MNTINNINVVDYNSWKEWATSDLLYHSIKEVYGGAAMMDINSADFLRNCFTGYMTAPVAMFKGLPLAAKSIKVEGTIDSIIEVKKFFEGLQTNTDIFLYQITFFPSFVTYKQVDMQTFETITLDPPVMSTPYWKIRYAVLNDEINQEGTI